MRLRGRAFAVFGAATGIGAASARRIAAEGGQVAIADIDLDGAEKTAAAIVADGGRALAVAVDIADEATVGRAVGEIVAAFGGLDGVHVNAADMRTIRDDGDILDTGLDVFDRTIAVNLRGHVLVTRAVLPHLLKKETSAIVYTGSGAWNAGEPQRAAYAMSKAGVNALMRHVAARWGKAGIRANCIAPGLTPTEASIQATGQSYDEQFLAIIPHTRLGKPADMAAMAAFLLSDDGAWVSGQVLGVNGGGAFC